MGQLSVYISGLVLNGSPFFFKTLDPLISVWMDSLRKWIWDRTAGLFFADVDSLPGLGAASS
jgi:hypothetical protein